MRTGISLTKLLLCLACLGPLAQAAVYLDSSTPGYYNQALGTILDGTSAAFPTNTDPGQVFPTAPDLTPAAPLLGGWLQDPPLLDNGFWTAVPVSIPASWPVWSETAAVIPFEVPAPGAVNLVARFGVDNGVFCWLDGQYIYGSMDQGTAAPWEYNFPLPDLAPGTHHLQVLREDHGGGTGFYVMVEGLPGEVHTVAAHEASQAFSLAPAHPNPFNPTTTLSYSLSQAGTARLAVYNMQGQQVAVLADGLATRGEHQVQFDASRLPAGLYLARLEAAGSSQTQKLLLVK